MEKEENDQIAEVDKKLLSIFTDYSLGIFLGFVLGFLVSKVYQTWAIVYRDSHYDNNRPTSWMTDSPPNWITVTENPDSFLSFVVFLFIIIGIIFTFCLRKRFKSMT